MGDARSMAAIATLCAVLAATAVNVVALPSKPTASAGCGSKPWWLTPGTLQDALPINVSDPLNPTGQRDYSLYVPSTYTGTEALPFVWSFHGFYDRARKEAREDKIFQIAEREKFIVVYPNGFPDSPKGREAMTNSWNIGGSEGTNGTYGKICDPTHDRYPCFASCAAAGICKQGKTPAIPNDCHCSTCVDDLGYIIKLWDTMLTSLCIDTSRQHGTGMSNGAIMLY